MKNLTAGVRDINMLQRQFTLDSVEAYSNRLETLPEGRFAKSVSELIEPLGWCSTNADD